jgi:hypothetical protein
MLFKYEPLLEGQYTSALARWGCDILGVDWTSPRTFRTCIYGASRTPLVPCSCHERTEQLPRLSAFGQAVVAGSKGSRLREGIVHLRRIVSKN